MYVPPPDRTPTSLYETRTSQDVRFRLPTAPAPISSMQNRQSPPPRWSRPLRFRGLVSLSRSPRHPLFTLGGIIPPSLLLIPKQPDSLHCPFRATWADLSQPSSSAPPPQQTTPQPSPPPPPPQHVHFNHTFSVGRPPSQPPAAAIASQQLFQK